MQLTAVPLLGTNACSCTAHGAASTSTPSPPALPAAFS